MANYVPTDEELIETFREVTLPGRPLWAGCISSPTILAYARAVLAMAKEPPPLSTTLTTEGGNERTVVFDQITRRYVLRTKEGTVLDSVPHPRWRNLAHHALNGAQLDKLAALAKRVEERGL